jgi:hypothetical protein
MPGSGPAPKLPGQRRRYNQPTRGEWVDLEPLEAPVLPSLPARDDGEKWPMWTLMMWDAWRMDPVTTQWGPSDVHFALETARIHAMDVSGTETAEIRLRCDRLGLTPKGKRDLRWRTPNEVKTIKKAEEQANVRKLHAVKDKEAG